MRLTMHRTPTCVHTKTNFLSSHSQTLKKIRLSITLMCSRSDKQRKVRESRVLGVGGWVGVSLIDRPDNALVDWPTVLSDPHLIPTSPHPLCQKRSFTMLLQPAEKALLEDRLRTSSSWRAELSFVCLGAKELYRLWKKSIERLMDG